MFPVLLHTPWFNVYSYGLLLAIGYTAGTIWILLEARRDGLPVEAVFDMLLLQMVVGVFGSRLLCLLECAPGQLTPLGILAFESGGLTFYGAVVSSLVFDLLYLKYMRLPFWRVMDCVGFGLPLGIAVARVGCFLNGCCHGLRCDWPWGVVFPRVSDLPVHPTQLYESAAGLGIFALLQAFRRRRRNRGEVFVACLGLYGGFRFFVEFWRGDNPILALGLTLSQWVGAGMAAAGVAAWRLIGRTPDLRIAPVAEETVTTPPQV